MTGIRIGVASLGVMAALAGCRNGGGTGGGGGYKCGYGPLVGGKPGPIDPITSPYPVTAKPVTAGQTIDIVFAGSGPFGSFDSMALAKTASALAITEDITKDIFTPDKDVD